MISRSYWITNYRILLENNPEDLDVRLAKLIYIAHEKGFVEWEDLDKTRMRRRGIIDSFGHKVYIFIIYDPNVKSELNPCFRITITPDNFIPSKRTSFFLGDDAWAIIFRMFADKIKIKEAFKNSNKNISYPDSCTQEQN